MKHYLNEVLFQRLIKLDEHDELNLIWNVILCDDTLCPLLRDEKIDVYYRGFKAFSLSLDGVIRNPIEFANDLYNYDIPEQLPGLDFMKYLPYMKQGIDLWYGARTNCLYKREFSQVIMRENNSLNAGNQSDYFIIDMEHQYKKGGAIPDLVGLIMERGKRQKPVFRMSIIEVKYMDSAFSGVAGILSHIEDYVKLINDKEMLEDMTQDIREMFFQSKKLGLLPGLRNQYERIEISDEHPELLLALVSRNTNNGKKQRTEEVESLRAILEKAIEKYVDYADDICIAGTAELGFGLYSDRKKSIKECLSQQI